MILKYFKILYNHGLILAIYGGVELSDKIFFIILYSYSLDLAAMGKGFFKKWKNCHVTEKVSRDSFGEFLKRWTPPPLRSGN